MSALLVAEQMAIGGQRARRRERVKVQTLLKPRVQTKKGLQTCVLVRWQGREGWGANCLAGLGCLAWCWVVVLLVLMIDFSLSRSCSRGRHRKVDTPMVAQSTLKTPVRTGSHRPPILLSGANQPHAGMFVGRE